jgi:hypothetical protein
MFTGPQPKEAHQRRKFTLDILKKLPKPEKSQIFDVLLTGPRDPRYGSGLNSSQNLKNELKNESLLSSKTFLQS